MFGYPGLCLQPAAVNTTTGRRELLTSPALQPAVIGTKGQTLPAVLIPFVSSKCPIELMFQPAHSDNWICNELSVTYGGRDSQSTISHNQESRIFNSSCWKTGNGALRACSNDHLHRARGTLVLPSSLQPSTKNWAAILVFAVSAKAANLPGFWGLNLRDTKQEAVDICASTLIPSGHSPSVGSVFLSYTIQRFYSKLWI